MGCQSVNANAVGKRRRVAVCNAANHCLARLSVCSSVNCEPDGAWRKVLRGVPRSHVTVALWRLEATANGVTLKARARQGRQGKATSRCDRSTAHCCLHHHRRRCNTRRHYRHHPLSRRVLALRQLSTLHYSGDNDHILRSDLRIVAATNHNIPCTRSRSRLYPHHEQQLHADAALGSKLHNAKCWRTCSRPQTKACSERIRGEKEARGQEARRCTEASAIDTCRSCRFSHPAPSRTASSTGCEPASCRCTRPGTCEEALDRVWSVYQQEGH